MSTKESWKTTSTPRWSHPLLTKWASTPPRNRWENSTQMRPAITSLIMRKMKSWKHPAKGLTMRNYPARNALSSMKIRTKELISTQNWKKLEWISIDPIPTRWHLSPTTEKINNKKQIKKMASQRKCTLSKMMWPATMMSICSTIVSTRKQSWKPWKLSI